MHVLNNIGMKKPAFAALKEVQAIPIIRKELQVLREHSATLGKAMIDVAPVGPIPFRAACIVLVDMTPFCIRTI